MLNISPFSFGLVIQQVFDNGSIYNPVVLDITEETAFPLPGGCPQCSQRMPADWLPDCCHLYPILSSMGTSGSWLCLWRLITPSHLLKRSRPSWLIYLHLWLRPPPQPRTRQGWNKGRVGGVGGGYGIQSLWLITKKQPTWPALFVKWENKALFILK